MQELGNAVDSSLLLHEELFVLLVFFFGRGGGGKEKLSKKYSICRYFQGIP